MFRQIGVVVIVMSAVLPLTGCMVPGGRLARSADGINLDGTPQDVQVYPLGGLGTVESVNTEHLAQQTMDNSDQIKLLEAVANNPTYKSTSWVNPGTGAKITVVPTSNMVYVKGNKDCRQYRVTVLLNGQKGHLHGAACKQGNGTWQMVG